MVQPDVKASDGAGAATGDYQDPFLQLIHSWAPTPDKNWGRAVVEGGNSYLNQLTPDQLIERYKGLSGITNGDFSQYQAQKYGQGNLQDQTNYTAYQTFKSLLGRDPSGNEFSQILPAFQGPNGLMNGRAALANLQQQYKSNPTQDPTSTQNNQKPGDISGSVSQQFQSILGRAPTSDELSHFTQAIQSNQTDAYGLGDFLKQMPENTNAQDARFRGSLNNELQNYDTTEFNKEKSGIMADYQSRGMAPGTSPSLDYALTDLMGKIAQNRSQYLAGVSAQQYGGNKDLAIGNYQNTLNQMYGQNQSNMQGQRQYGQQLLNQGFQGADYQTQMNDFMKYMNANKGSGGGSNPLYGAVGGLIGAGIGGMVAGPGGGAAGAGAGYKIGSGAGNAFGYLNQR